MKEPNPLPTLCQINKYLTSYINKSNIGFFTLYPLRPASTHFTYQLRTTQPFYFVHTYNNRETALTVPLTHTPCWHSSLPRSPRQADPPEHPRIQAQASLGSGTVFPPDLYYITWARTPILPYDLPFSEPNERFEGTRMNPPAGRKRTIGSTGPGISGLLSHLRFLYYWDSWLFQIRGS